MVSRVADATRDTILQYSLPTRRRWVGRNLKDTVQKIRLGILHVLGDLSLKSLIPG
jgi:hypothetical protein